MSQNRVPAFLTILRESQLLEPEQVQELAQSPEARAGDLNGLAKGALHKGWLTRFQLNLISQGKTKELMFGPYRLLERLGEGSMGQVFKAYHPPMSRTVALKVIRKDRLPNPQAVQRFFRAVQAAAKLAHPNLVVPFDANHVHGTPFFAMEYVDGIDLARLVQRDGPLPPQAAADYVRQAALGLQFAHEKGMVHRDLKPSNLLVAAGPGSESEKGNGRKGPAVVKILDLGLAHLGGGLVPANGALIGTPEYMAPEQADSPAVADIRSDLYSLGTVLFFLLTGRPPFAGDTLKELQLRHRLEPPLDVQQLRKEVPAELAAIVSRLLAKKPEDRFQTPQTLAQALAPIGEISAAQPAAIPTAAVVEAGMAFELVEEEETPFVATEVDADAGAPVASAAAVRKPDEEEALFQPAAVKPVLPVHSASIRARRPQPAAGLNKGLIAALAAVTVVLVGGIILYLAFPTGEADKPTQQVQAVVPVGNTKTAVTPTSAGPAPAVVRFSLLPLDPVALKGGEKQVLEVKIARKGTGGKPIQVYLEDLPPGVSADFATIDPRRDTAQIQIVAAPDVENAQGTVKVVATNGAATETGDFQLTVMSNPVARGELKRINGKGFSPQAAWFLPPEGRQALTLNSDNALRVWDVEGGREVKALPNPNLALRGGALSADGKQVLLGWSNNTAQLLDWDSGKQLHLFQHPGPVDLVAATPDGKIGLVAGGTAMTANGATTIKDAAVRVWDLVTGKEIAKLDRPNELVRAAALAADGGRAATYAEPSTITVWSLPAGQAINRLQVTNAGSLTRLAFSPDGRFLLGAWPNQVLILNAALNSGRRASGHDGAITALAVSPDSKFFLTGGGNVQVEDGKTIPVDCTVRLWDLETGLQLKQFTGHADRVESVAFSADGRRAISTSADQSIRVWDLTLPAANP